jgi:hypothetical protein
MSTYLKADTPPCPGIWRSNHEVTSHPCANNRALRSPQVRSPYGDSGIRQLTEHQVRLYVAMDQTLPRHARIQLPTTLRMRRDQSGRTGDPRIASITPRAAPDTRFLSTVPMVAPTTAPCTYGGQNVPVRHGKTETQVYVSGLTAGLFNV